MKVTFVRWLTKQLLSISKDRTLLFLLLFTIIYFLVFSYLSIMQHEAFYTANDLGIFNHKLYNTLHGRFYLSAEGGETHYGHMDYLILSFLPIYAVFPYPHTLLVLQSAFLAAAAVPLYLLARKKLKNKKAAFILSITYLFYPALHYVNLYDYHSITLSVPLIITAFYFYETERFRLSLLSFSLAMLAKETVSIFVILTGIYFFLKKRERNAAYLTVCALIWFFISMFILFPSDMVAGQSYFDTYGGRYSHLGETQSEVISAILSDPISALSRGGFESRTDFLFQIFAPVGFLSFLDPVILITIPQFTAAFLSRYEWMRDITQSYSTIIIPFVLISAVYSLTRLKKIFKRNLSFPLAIFILVCCLLSFFTFGMGHPANTAELSKRTQPNRELSQTVNSIADAIPSNATVSAPHHIFPHLWGKKMIYRLQDHFQEILYNDEYERLPDYIILDFSEKYYRYDLPEQEVTSKLNSRGYSVAFNESTVFLYHLKSEQDPT